MPEISRGSNYILPLSLEEPYYRVAGTEPIPPAGSTILPNGAALTEDEKAYFLEFLRWKFYVNPLSSSNKRNICSLLSIKVKGRKGIQYLHC
jgi:hypothetical protein